MPAFRKLSPVEVATLDQPAIDSRAEIARAYDAYLADFVIGDYGRAELVDGEQRAVVRRRLHAAAHRRGLVLRFRSGPGPLTFHVVAAVAISTLLPLDTVIVTSVSAPIAVSHSPRPSRPPRERQTAVERYRDMLPRWMRTGEAVGAVPGQRRNGGKRRSR